MYPWPSPDRTKPRPVRAAAASLAVACAVAAFHPAAAQPISTMGALPTGGDLPANTKVIDLRAPGDCLRGSLPAARCLPAQSLFDRAGDPVSFHALRWLLGTAGLNGTETVVVYAGGSEAISDDALDDAWAMAALLHLAGQKRVLVYNGMTPDDLQPGTGRSLSREAVYTALMRDRMMIFGTPPAPLRYQLITFARGGGTSPIVVAPNT